ncbi:MAG: MarR family transcriptional regulator [Actinobacteria bacterium]|nr:MarR family transcriptional regulator [Actinomycetota bacterium]
MSDPGPERPEALQAWMGLCEVVDRVRILVNRDLQATVGLTLAENLVLCQVAMAPGRRLRMAEIAGTLSVAKSAVTKTVDHLQERGLLARERDPRDRRTVYATLTCEGANVFAAAQPAFGDAVQRYFAGHLDEDTLHRLRGLPGSVLPPENG